MMIEHSKGGTSCSSDSNGSNMSCRSRCANNYFPDDLMIEVLSRLPYKTFVRFMCVSKSWRNLISNSLLLSPMSGLLLWGLSRRLPDFENPPDVFIPLLPSGSNCNCLEALQSHCASLRTCDPKITVIDYCNGLFLFSNKQWPEKAYYVCNPATNQCVALPEPPPFSAPYFHYSGSALLFDPRKSRHYKVLRCYLYFDGCCPKQVEVQIFSSDKSQWVSFSTYSRPCIIGTDHNMELYVHPFVYLNGALHCFCSSISCLIIFYVEEKRFREFELPHMTSAIRTQCLGESEGRLYHVVCHFDELNIWMFGSLHPDKWFKKHTLRIANFGKAISLSNYSVCFDIVAFHTNMEVLFINQGGVIFSYYFGSGRKDGDRLEEICTVGHNPYICFSSPYSHCLFPLKDVCNRRSS